MHTRSNAANCPTRRLGAPVSAHENIFLRASSRGSVHTCISRVTEGNNNHHNCAMIFKTRVYSTFTTTKIRGDAQACIQALHASQRKRRKRLDRNSTISAVSFHEHHRTTSVCGRPSDVVLTVRQANDSTCLVKPFTRRTLHYGTNNGLRAQLL